MGEGESLERAERLAGMKLAECLEERGEFDQKYGKQRTDEIWQENLRWNVAGKDAITLLSEFTRDMGDMYEYVAAGRNAPDLKLAKKVELAKKVHDAYCKLANLEPQIFVKCTGENAADPAKRYRGFRARCRDANALFKNPLFPDSLFVHEPQWRHSEHPVSEDSKFTRRQILDAVVLILIFLAIGYFLWTSTTEGKEELSDGDALDMV